MDLWVIFEVITSMIDSVLIFGFYHLISNGLKKSRILYLFIALGYTSATYIGGAFEINPTVKLISVLLYSCVMVTITLDIKFKKAVVSTFYVMLAMIISESLVMGLLMGIYGLENTEIFLEQDGMRFQALVIAKTIYLFILYLGYRLFFLKSREKNVKEIILIVFQTITYMGLLLLAMELSRKNITNDRFSSYTYCIVALISLVGYIMFIRISERCFVNQKEKYELLEYKEKNKRIEQYFEIKIDTNEKIKRMYHDLKGHLNVLKNMQQMKLEGFEQYLNHMEQSVSLHENIYNTGCSIVDALLFDKMQEIKEMNVEVEISIEEECLKEYEPFFLCTIFNNIIDNAIESIEREKSSEGLLIIKIHHVQEQVGVLFSNSCKVKPAKDIFGNVITSKQDKSQHGFGLKNIKDAVKEINGTVSIEWENEMFEVFVLI